MTNNFDKFKEFRNLYPNFIYHSFEKVYSDDELKIIYHFEIEGLKEFNPSITFNRKIIRNDIDEEFMDYLIFHVGMVELVSYFKCTCSPNVIIKAGYVDEEQMKWFKKLYYYGLGEFFYVNNIETDEESFMNIKCVCDKKEYKTSYIGKGHLIPIGGGKDSVVSLELLKEYKNINNPFIINPKEVTLDCANVAGYDNDSIVTVKRVIDKNLIELNSEEFLNGHTPFSALVAFLSYLSAYLCGKKYIILSNESSANEATVVGTKINHQYSKTYEFENDFNNYTKKYFNIDIKYFSLLRPLSEFQIGMLFSNYEKYHLIFKSCNVGSKEKTWRWCCNCPKCLFVYIILSPFLYKDKLINIFGEDLLEKESLLETFKELIGSSDAKPFECVGTINEVRYASSLVIKSLEDKNIKLPYLLKYYKDNYNLLLDDNIKTSFNNENNLDDIFVNILKKELDKYV